MNMHGLCVQPRDLQYMLGFNGDQTCALSMPIYLAGGASRPVVRMSRTPVGVRLEAVLSAGSVRVLG